MADRPTFSANLLILMMIGMGGGAVLYLFTGEKYRARRVECREWGAYVDAVLDDYPNKHLGPVGEAFRLLHHKSFAGNEASPYPSYTPHEVAALVNSVAEICRTR